MLPEPPAGRGAATNIDANARVVHRSPTVNIARVLKHWARDRGDRIALRVSDERLDYSALDRWADAIAADLRAAGVVPGDRVAFYGDTSIEWCAAAFGVIRAGGIVAPINARMIAAEVDYLLGRYEPRLVFADAEGAARLRDWGLAGVEGQPALLMRETIAASRGQAVEPIVIAIDPDAPVGIITTSGSTARPKGVVYSHRSMIDYAQEEASDIHADIAGEEVRLFTAAPMSTAGGFNLMIHSVIMGMSIFMLEAFDPAAALALIAQERINVFRASPVFFQRMADLPAFADADLSSLRVTTIGGAPPAVKLLAAWRDKGVLLQQLYGQTEGGGALTVNPARFALSDPDRCGYGAPFTELAIVDEAGERVPPDTPGEIVARKAGMMIGYWRDPDATAGALIDGWLHTGDIGTLDDRGLLKMLDRMKDIIKSGGLNISSAELERVILEVEGVAEVAIIAVPDEKFGETPFAIVQGPDCDVDAIVAHCRAQLSSYKLPRYISVSPDPLPRLAMGKISKPALRREWAQRPLPPPLR